MVNIVSITELREKTVKVLNEAAEKQQLLYIVVRSKPKVVLEPIELYEAREEELARLRKKVFEYETLKSLKEAKEGKVKIFKSAKALLASVKNNK